MARLKNALKLLPALLLAAPVFAEGLEAKQLAGPPAEFAAMKPATPQAAATVSKSALLPVELAPAADGSLAWSAELPVEGEQMRLLLLSGDAEWNVSLRTPGNTRSVQAASVASQTGRVGYGLPGNEYPATYYALEQLQRGTLGLQVSAAARSSQQRGFVLLEGAGPQRLESRQARFNQLTGQRIGLVARVYSIDAAGAEDRAASATIGSAQLRITTPEGRTYTEAMFDDGRHADGAAGDGVYGGDFLAASAGSYNAQVLVQGRGADGYGFVRSAEHLIPVLAPDLALAAAPASARLVDGQRLSVAVPVQARAAGSHYRVLAQVWGSASSEGAKGTSVPVAWIGGMVEARDGSLDLALDTRWIAAAGARAPFELRELRIEDPDHFVTLASAERLAFATPALPTTKFSGITDDMRTGPRPASLPTRGVGQRLLLVHGYCSGNVWGGVAGQFSTASVFQDLNQNRSHDAFAQRIKTFGNTWNSYGIVAHSQGGAAALHLYTYYWSGLDYATGSRLIQSVGTPYQGTALAGNAAAIGNVFGVGCGTNSNLTYSGASSWLAGIPASSRAKVNYYTTSFTDRAWLYDYCHIATDVLLSDPDDGTTERAYGQLSGAVNQGHKTGWCHTGGMRDPAQTTDSSRNSTMNANAAR